jgi:hypothetical protein
LCRRPHHICTETQCNHVARSGLAIFLFSVFMPLPRLSEVSWSVSD